MHRGLSLWFAALSGAALPALLAGTHLLWFTVAQAPGFVDVVRWFRALPLT